MTKRRPRPKGKPPSQREGWRSRTVRALDLGDLLDNHAEAVASERAEMLAAGVKPGAELEVVALFATARKLGFRSIRHDGERITLRGDWTDPAKIAKGLKAASLAVDSGKLTRRP